ncbi:MAG: DegT/DnrJ/EryC1/StrS family aminotransferase [Ruminococcaceae bacterium]|nr:DegT/DnrJ/EryC1/StrS family aminotransferase [Oscillospiraceae bacterium]
MFRIGQEEIKAVERVINSKELFKINSGTLQETYHCEKEFREKFNISHAVLMTSGNAALMSALAGMGIGPGDEVIVPAYTYIATAISVVSVGAIPIIAEIDETLMLDPKDVEQKITERTKAIIPVHMMGYPCNMDGIMKVAKKHNLKVLEDACQAVGGSFRGKPLGTFGDAGAFSFNFYKIITAGEGGALLTNDKTIFEKGLIYHDSSAVAYFGNQMEDFSEEPFCGYEFRTNEITAAILREQLKRLDGIVSDLRKNKQRLMDALSPYFKFIPSNDKEGDCGMTLTLQFDSAEEAQAFRDKNVGVSIPAFTGKHVYNNWTPILHKRGAAHPLMDPFKMAANRVPDYTEDMCQKSIDILLTCAHLSINPDWTEEQVAERAKQLIDALK